MADGYLDLPIEGSGSGDMLASTYDPAGGARQVAFADSVLSGVVADAPLTGAGTAASHLVMPAASTTVSGYLTTADWNTFNGKDAVLTFANGVTRTLNNVENDLITGKSGGQTVIGDTVTAGNLILRGNAANLTTGQVNITSSKDAASVSNASLSTAGGLGVTKKAFFGDAISGTTATLSTAIADNTSTTAVATTKFAKSEAAVLRRHPTQALNLVDSVTANGVTVVDSDSLDVGASNFSLLWTGLLPDWTPLATVYLMGKMQNLTTDYTAMFIDTAGKLNISLLISGGTTISKLTSVALGFVDGTSHSILVTVTRETATVAGTIAIYLDGVFLENLAITAGTPANFSNTGSVYILGNQTGVQYSGSCSVAAIYNYAIPFSNIVDIFRNGINVSDKWGTSTPMYTSNFSADADSFTGVAATVTGNIDGIGGVNDVLKIEATGVTAAGRRLITLTAGKNYRVTWDQFHPVNVSGTGIRVATYAGGVYIILAGTTYNLSADNTWETKFQDFLCPAGATGLRFYMCNASAIISTVGDLAYLKNITVTEIGATMALQPEGLLTDKWIDSSSNANHGSYPANGSTLTRPQLYLRPNAGSIVAGTAPAKFTSGPLLTVPEVGAVEFLTDKFFATTTTGPTRKEIQLYGNYYGEFYAYNKAIAFSITVADTYQPICLVSAGDIVTGLVSGFTFNAGRVVDANITSEASGTGGKLRIVDSAAHGLTTGDLVVIGNANNAGHNKPTRITLDGTNPTTEFLCDDITYVAGAGASAATVKMPSYLQASTGSAGIYSVVFTIDGTASNANKDWKWELNNTITPQDNIVTERLSTNTLTSMSSSGIVSIADGDRLWISGKNSTDTTDYTVKNINLNVHRV